MNANGSLLCLWIIKEAKFALTHEAICLLKIWMLNKFLRGSLSLRYKFLGAFISEVGFRFFSSVGSQVFYLSIITTPNHDCKLGNSLTVNMIMKILSWQELYISVADDLSVSSTLYFKWWRWTVSICFFTQ